MFPIYTLLSSETVEELLFIGFIRTSQSQLHQIVPTSVLHTCFMYYFEPFETKNLSDDEIERMICQVLVESDFGSFAQQLLNEVHQQSDISIQLNPTSITPNYKLLLSQFDKRNCIAKLYHMNNNPEFQANVFKLCVFLYNLRRHPKFLNLPPKKQQSPTKTSAVNSTKTTSTSTPIPTTSSTPTMADVAQNLLFQLRMHFICMLVYFCCTHIHRFDDDINDYLVYVNKIYNAMMNFSDVMSKRIGQALIDYPLVAGVHVQIYYILIECGHTPLHIKQLCDKYPEKELRILLELLQSQKKFYLHKVNKYEKRLHKMFIIKQRKSIKQETTSLRKNVLFLKKQMELQESKLNTEIKMAQNNFQQQLRIKCEIIEKLERDKSILQSQLRMQYKMHRQPKSGDNSRLSSRRSSSNRSKCAGVTVNSPDVVRKVKKKMNISGYLKGISSVQKISESGSEL